MPLSGEIIPLSEVLISDDPTSVGHNKTAIIVSRRTRDVMGTFQARDTTSPMIVLLFQEFGLPVSY